MLKQINKHQTLITILLVLILLTTFFLFPAQIQIVSLIMLLTSIGMAMLLIFQQHQRAYDNAECTRERMTRNLTLDLLGLLFAMGVAMVVGRWAGSYVGPRAGFWVGLVAGFAGGFLAAWGVRSMWGRLVRLA